MAQRSHRQRRRRHVHQQRYIGVAYHRRRANSHKQHISISPRSRHQSIANKAPAAWHRSWRSAISERRAVK